MGIEIEGLSELSDMLTDIAPSAARRYMRKALGAGADVVQEAAEDTAPEGIGILEESIVQKAIWSSDDDAGTTTLEIDIGPTKHAFWGMFQEFGTQEVIGTDENGKPFHHTAQPGQHWLQRAWESSKDRCLDVVATEMTGLQQDLENKQ